MDIDPQMFIPIKQAFDANDIAEFRRLIAVHPEHLRDVRDGTDCWMWPSAMDGNLEMLQALIELGLGVDESKDVPDPDNPFCTFEGPILHAAMEGHVEIVRWLLEKGAKINYTVNGQVRCLPLLDAARNGHLEVVKMLVEHGADLNFQFNGHTPASQADGYGHPEVAAYLRSVGAM